MRIFWKKIILNKFLEPGVEANRDSICCSLKVLGVSIYLFVFSTVVHLIDDPEPKDQQLQAFRWKLSSCLPLLKATALSRLLLEISETVENSKLSSLQGRALEGTREDP